MANPARLAFAAALVAVLAAGRIGAADGPPSQFGRPPTKVLTATGEIGVLAPQAEFPGSVYFKEVSQVATEVRGKVLEVLIEDGQRVEKGQLLVRLDAELLRRDLGATRARLGRDRTMVKNAETRLARAEELATQGLSPAEQLDETRFQAQGLRYSVAAAEAELGRLEALIAKTEIFAPFDGIVLDRTTELGEWKSEGSTVAVLARENQYEVLINVPEASIPFVEPGMGVELHVGGERMTGIVTAVIPRGDIASRTFPVKLKLETASPVFEGMTARARLPIGKQVECLLLPRDAVLNQLGSTYVFTAQDGAARKHPVEIVGYDGMTAGVVAPELGPQQLFIVKGHERLLEGDPVEIVTSAEADAPVSAAPAAH